jgi:hypothetical protein
MADVGKPVEILDKQLDLARFWGSPAGARTGEGFIKTISAQEKYPLFYSDPSGFGAFNEFCLYRSLPYFITDQMVDRIWQFSKGYDTLGFYPEDIPCPYGFMWLAKPIYVLDARGKMLSNRVITWVKQAHGMGIAFYTDKHDDLDEENLLLKAELGERYQHLPELALNHVQPVAWGDQTEFFLYDEAEIDRKYKDTWGKDYEPDLIAESMKEYFAMTRFLLACWEWMGEQLPSMAVPHRQMARRLGRSNLDAREVLIIDLQARARDNIPPATHQVVRWHYRWRSRAHKRRWTNKKTGETRLIDVVGCIKGPQGLPLVEKDVLYKVRRGRAPYEAEGAITDTDVTKHA